MSTIRPCRLWQEELDRYTAELDALKTKAREGEITEAEYVRIKALPWKIESLRQRQSLECRKAYQPDIVILK